MNRSWLNPAGSRLLLAAAALFAIALTPTAGVAADREDVPRDVVSFFHEEVARAVATSLKGAQTLDDGAVPLRADGLEVGAIARVHELSDEALAGKSAELVAREEWVAPLYSMGELVGTVAAWRDPAQKGELALAYFDTDTASGRAVESLPVEARMVVDPPIGARFAFDGETLTSLVELPEMLKVGQAYSLEEYGSYVRERAAATAHLSPEEGWSGGYDAPPQSSSPGDVVQLLGALAFVAGLGLFLVQRRSAS